VQSKLQPWHNRPTSKEKKLEVFKELVAQKSLSAHSFFAMYTYEDFKVNP